MMKPSRQARGHSKSAKQVDERRAISYLGGA